MTTVHYVLELDGRRVDAARYNTAEHASDAQRALRVEGRTVEVVAVFPCDHPTYWTLRGYSPYTTTRVCRTCEYSWTTRTAPTPHDLRVMADAGMMR